MESYRIPGCVKGAEGTVCGLRKNGANGIGESGYLVPFLCRFLSHPPPLGEAVITVSIMILGGYLVPPPSHFPISPIVLRVFGDLGTFGFGCLRGIGCAPGVYCLSTGACTVALFHNQVTQPSAGPRGLTPRLQHPNGPVLQPPPARMPLQVLCGCLRFGDEDLAVDDAETEDLLNAWDVNRQRPRDDSRVSITEEPVQPRQRADTLSELPRLWPPGRIVWLRRDGHSHKVNWVERESFANVVVTDAMIADHMPDALARALSLTVAGCAQQADVNTPLLS